MYKLDCYTSEFFEDLNELLLSGSVVPVYVSGSSMNPFLVSRRDIVWLSKFTIVDSKIGRIVLFRRKDGSLVLHRIKKVLSENKVQVMGDAQNWSEDVDIDSIVAVVTEIQRKEKKRSADSLYWKTISAIWFCLLPVRSVIMRFWFRFKR